MERIRFMEQYGYLIIRWLIGALGSLAGGIIAIVNPTIPMLTVFTFFVVGDSISAWRLSRRVRELHPKANDGKFKSRHFGRIFNTLLSVYFLAWLANAMQVHIVTSNAYLPNLVVGFACGWQFWSILENESSCNEDKWAKFLQKFLVSKASRHFDYNFQKDLEEYAKQKAQEEEKLSEASRDKEKD